MWPEGGAGGAVEKGEGLDGPGIERPVLREDIPQVLRDQVGVLPQHVELGGEILRRRNVRHGALVGHPGLRAVKRRRQGEDGFPVLDRGDPAGGEAPSVARAVHEVDDRDVQVALQDEVAVQRVRVAVGIVDRALGRDQRLGQHLSAEDPPRADVAILAAIDVPLDRFEIEKGDQGVGGVEHGDEDSAFGGGAVRGMGPYRGTCPSPRTFRIGVP